jgi:uridine kinase
VVVVEGLFVLHYRKIRNLLDLKVYVHAKENLKVIRRIKRDRIERGYPLDDVLYRYEHHVLPSFEKYVLPYMEIADIVVNNNETFENGLGVLLGFIESKTNI